MNKLMVGSIAIAMFLLAGCGAAGEGPPEPGPVTSADAILGTWHRTSGGPWYLAFHEDGTLNGSQGLEAVVEGRGGIEYTYRFEGTQLIVEGSGGSCLEDSQLIGIYEVHMLKNGNLKFLAIEEDCADRETTLAGRPDDGITREYEPVPYPDDGTTREY